MRRIKDYNRSLSNNFKKLLEICGDDRKKAKQIQLILKRSYRNEREQNHKEFHYRLTRIHGELTRIMDVQEQGHA